MTPSADNSPNGSGSDKGSLRDVLREARKSSSDVAQLVGYSKKTLSVAIVKRPPDGSYWRVRGDDDWAPENLVYSLLPPKDGSGVRDYHLVTPEMEEAFGADRRLSNLVRTCKMAFAVDTRGAVCWWAIPLGENTWWKSSREAMALLKNQWGMLKASDGRYELELPDEDGKLGRPQWPAGSPEDWLEKAFKGKVIDNLDHPVVKELQGRR